VPNPQRIAVIDVSHWHARYDAAYMNVLRDLNVKIVGVSDQDSAIAQQCAADYGAQAFSDYRAMVDESKPEFVIALGRHSEMPETFRYLIDTGIPFVMEKPWGVDAETVTALADLAEAKGAWVAAPFMIRYLPWAQTAKRMFEAGEFGTVSHIFFRMIRPTMQRYYDWTSPWMYERAVAGGGSLTNLGPHGMDVARFITGEEPEVISAVTSHSVHKVEVEDYALATLRTPSGIIVHNEVGYTMPTWPKNSSDLEQKVAGEKALLELVPEGLHVLTPDRDEVIQAESSFAPGYPLTIRDCLERVGAGRPPPVTARDCARAVQLIHDAYRLAGRS
jgi:predicted dehydrogenase